MTIIQTRLLALLKFVKRFMKVQIVVWELVVGSGGLEKVTSIKLLEYVLK